MRTFALIEIASNFVKMTIAKIQGEFFNVVDEIVDYVKLAEDVNNDGFLKPNRINETLTLLKGYKKLAESYKVEEYSVVAGYAIREAKNQKSFVDEVLSTIGLKVKILTEQEEVNAIYTSCINTLDVPKGVVLDIESESTVLAIYIRRNVLFEKVFPFGANTLTQMFEGDNVVKQNELIYNHFFKALKEIEELNSIEPEFQLVGSGYFFESFSKLSRGIRKYPLDINHGLISSKNDVENVYNFVKGLDLSKKKKLRGISEDRADVVSAVVAMIKATADACSNIENIHTSSYGLSYGLLLNNANETTTEKPITDILGNSLERQYVFNETSRTNSEHVYELSMLLFKQLRVLHKLPRTYVKSLRVASFMHDSGIRINFVNHTKNSFEVVLNEQVFGLTHRELLVASFICASQNLNDFSLADFVKFRDILGEEDLVAIKKLAVIVAIAEALDRCGNGAVKDINCDILGDSVILKAVSELDVSFEIKEATKLAGDFLRAYGKNIEIL